MSSATSGRREQAVAPFDPPREKVLAIVPEVRAAVRANRTFVGRAVRFLAEAGIRQFLDVGSGLPTRRNVHEVANRAAPDARVVYVDYDYEKLGVRDRPAAVGEAYRRRLLS